MVAPILSRRFKAAVGVAVAVACTALAFQPQLRGAFLGIEERSLDYRFLLRGRQPTEQLPIVIVLITDEAVQPYGFKSPVPRKLMAQVVQTLAAKGARCIGFDYIFNQPSLPDHDAALAAAMAAVQVPVVVANGTVPPFQGRAILGNPEVLADSNGRAKYFQLRAGGGDVTDSLAYALYKACGGPPLMGLAAMSKELVNFYGPPSRLDRPETTFNVFPAESLARLPETVFKGKIVLVGSGIETLGDVFLTPFSTREGGTLLTHGVELHATILGNLLEHRLLGAVSDPSAAALYLLLFGGIAAAVLYLRALAGALLSVVLLGAWIAAALLLFDHAALVLPVAVPLALAVVCFIVCMSWIYGTELRHSRFVRGVFGQYVAPEVIREMLDQGRGLDLGGETRQVSILFTDLEGFTTMSEKMTASDLVAVLNRYFEDMVQVILARNGTIGSYIGDAILAYFGAPVSYADHAARACHVALEMQAALGRFNESPAQHGLPKLRMRVGLNTGNVVVGNIGANERRNYTIIGDAVNLASRLEGTNKAFGTWILASDDIMQAAGPGLIARELGRIVVKGKTIGVPVHEIVGVEAQRDEPAIAAQIAKHAAYAEALALFYAGKFAEAAGAFRSCAAAGDPPAQFLLEQCEELMAAPPGERWNGAVVLHSK